MSPPEGGSAERRLCCGKADQQDRIRYRPKSYFLLEMNPSHELLPDLCTNCFLCKGRSMTYLHLTSFFLFSTSTVYQCGFKILIVCISLLPAFLWTCVNPISIFSYDCHTSPSKNHQSKKKKKERKLVGFTGFNPRSPWVQVRTRS